MKAETHHVRPALQVWEALGDIEEGGVAWRTEGGVFPHSTQITAPYCVAAFCQKQSINPNKSHPYIKSLLAAQ